MATKIQLRRDAAADWTSANPTLSAGEFGYETDTTKYKIGDGTTAWNSLGYVSTPITAVNNATANELTTIGATTTELDAEANLTFDGTTLGVTGKQTITNTTTDDSLLITTTEDSSTAAPVFTFKRNSGSPADGDYLGQIKWKGENDADQEVIYAKMTGKISDASDTTEDGLIEFALRKAGSNNIGARLTSTELKLINGTGLEVAGLTYPTSDGTNGQVLTTNGSGTLSFTTVSGGAASTGDITFTGSTINSPSNADITLNPGGTGDVVMPAISFQDNLITTNRSNDTLGIGANGTGTINLSTTDNFLTSEMTQTGTAYGANSINNIKGVGLLYKEDSIGEITADTDRRYSHALLSEWKLNTGINTSNSNMRFRNYIGAAALDMNGSSSTNTSFSRGPRAADFQTQVLNSNATAATLGSALGGASAIYLTSGDSAGNLTVTNAAALNILLEIEKPSGLTSTITNGYGTYYSSSISGSGSGGITNEYAYYVASMNGTNNYAFYSATDTAVSRVGTLERYRESINALTSSSTITVDCGLAPVHTVTLGTNTEFNISNLGTGQSVTIIITQDGTGSRTATFGTDGSTAVKFAGGTKTLSTAASAIDVVTIFNDGTNFIGNLATAYAA